MPSPLACRVRANVVNQLRCQQGLTQKELAKRADVSQRTIASLEAASGYFAPLTIHSVAKALSVSPEELIKGKKKRAAAQEHLENDLKPERGNVILMLVFAGGGRSDFDETLPYPELGEKIAEMITTGKLVPLAIRDGSIVLTAEVELLAALDLIHYFLMTTDVLRLVEIRIPAYSVYYLVPTTTEELGRAGKRLQTKTKAIQQARQRLRRNAEVLRSKDSQRSINLSIDEDGNAVLARGPGPREGKTSLTPHE